MIYYDPARTVPNWAPGAAEHLESLMNMNDICFEWGGGQSTGWLARLVQHGMVITVENNLEWLQRTVKLTEKMSNCHIVWSPKTMRRYVDAVDMVTPTVFLVDGYLRPECLKKVIDIAKPGNIILLDDALDYTSADRRVVCSTFITREDFPQDVPPPEPPMGEVHRMPHPHRGQKNLYGILSPEFKETWVWKVR
ncbi:MAG: hypothetical protein V3R87_02845 [Dehalococcoidia bacterium]